MSDCRNCIYKNDIYEFGNCYHCGKSGLDFEDDVSGPTCICREFYDSYNYIKDQDAVRERNHDDLLAAVVFGGDLLPDEEGDGQCSEGDDSDVKSFFFCFACIVALLVSETYGLVGLLVVFGVPYGIIWMLRKMDSALLWKLGISAMLLTSCFSALSHYDYTQINSYKSLLSENVYQKESWQTDQHGVVYLNVASNRPTMPLPDGQKRINGALSRFLREHNMRVEQRDRERNAGLAHTFQPERDQKLEAYFLGNRIIVVSSNAPQGLFEELKKRCAEKFDWQAFERGRGK